MNFTHRLTTTVSWDEDRQIWVATAGNYPGVEGVGKERFEALADLERKLLEREGVETEEES